MKCPHCGGSLTTADIVAELQRRDFEEVSGSPRVWEGERRYPGQLLMAELTRRELDELTRYPGHVVPPPLVASGQGREPEHAHATASALWWPLLLLLCLIGLLLLA